MKTRMRIVQVFILALTIVLLIGTLLKKNNDIMRYKQTILNNEIDLNGIIRVNNKLYDEDILQHESEDILINKDLLLKYSINENSIKLKNLLIHKPILVFRYSELNCNLCVDKQIEYIKKLGTDIGTENILIIATYRNIRDYITFKHINQLEAKVYNVASLGIPLEKYDTPFFFILDTNFRTKMVFIPKKEKFEMSEKYLQIIKKHYFKNLESNLYNF